MIRRVEKRVSKDMELKGQEKLPDFSG